MTAAHVTKSRPEETDESSPFHSDVLDAEDARMNDDPSQSLRQSAPHSTSASRWATQTSQISSKLDTQTETVGQTSLMALLGGSDSIMPRQSLSKPELGSSSNRSGRAFRQAMAGAGQERSAGRENEEEDDNEDDEEEDNQPPDFTSRVPLTAGANKRRSRILQSPPYSTTSTQQSQGWNGLRLGGGPVGGILGSRRAAGMSARERALWRWVNVEDLDVFLQQVYVYFVGKGIWAIGLSRLLNLLTIGWVIAFSTFLIGCIDYDVLWQSHSLAEVVVPRCISRFSGLTLLITASVGTFYLWRVIRFGLGVRKLWEMHEFYTELLEVPENDIQTIPWHFIVTRLSALRASHPSALSMRAGGSTTALKLDAHDIANRIMREENYLIALFNKDLLDLSMPVPAAMRRIAPRLSAWMSKSMLTKTLEWNLSFCLIGFLFGRDGQVRRAFLSDRNKADLTMALRHRFMLMALINAVFAPFIVLYLLMWSFFRYFEEYHKNPSTIGSRQFTQLARWKFREFNELPHLFQQRLNRAHPIADQYVNQFPKEKTALVSRFIAFLAGSFAAVLILFSLIDPDAFLHFEVTPGRTVLFYIGIFGTVLAVARGMVPDENKVVDTEELMRSIVEHTHYLPTEWRGKLHSAEVHAAFGQLFQMKVALFVQEVLSVIMTPFVLWYTLPECAGSIVDFFREFTVHVDGLGHVCSFAVFDFKRHGDVRFGAPVQGQTDVHNRWKSSEGKMEKSFLTFAQHHPSWVPRDQTQSLFLSTVALQHPHSNNTSSMVATNGLHGNHHTSTSQHVGMSIGAGHPVLHSATLQSTTSTANRHHPSSLGLHPRFAPMSSSHLGFNPKSPHALKVSSGGGNNHAFNSTLVEEDDAEREDELLYRSLPLRQVQKDNGLKQTTSVPEIEEEHSQLDHEPFVTPTDDAPFGSMSPRRGADDDEEDEDELLRRHLSGEGGQDPFVRESAKDGGIGGVLGELYDMHGKRW
ncbi:autophagy protein atg9 [Microbotryomycetes sp. JL201]|nr:autophagy protein atg9 [Microbotryomycetes sp. JL201]